MESKRVRGAEAAIARRTQPAKGTGKVRQGSPKDEETPALSYSVTQRPRHGCDIEGGNSSVDRGPSKCYKCGKEGHIARVCRGGVPPTPKDGEKKETPQAEA